MEWVEDRPSHLVIAQKVLNVSTTKCHDNKTPQSARQRVVEKWQDHLYLCERSGFTFSSRSNLTQYRQRLATVAMFLLSLQLRYPGAERRVSTAIRYTLRRNTASLMKNYFR